jgi:hypothetical protein
MTIARYYVADANLDGAHFPGVPLADLTEEEFDALPKWLQASIDASPLYRKTKPRAEAAPKAKRASESEPEASAPPDTAEKEAVNG